MMPSPQPRTGTHVSKKKITINGSTKTLLVTTHETNSSILIFIGGHDVYCIEAQIMKAASGEDPSIGNFTKIRFDVNCSLEHNFVRGYDTTMILKFLLTYIKRTYPYVNVMRFNDHSFRRNECLSSYNDENASMRTCDNGATVELSQMLYMIRGKTWYETHFGAYLADESAQKFKLLEDRFQEKKKTISWSMMKDIITTQFPIDEPELEDLYTKATTWQEFFAPLNERIGTSNMCIFMAPWLGRFVLQYFRFNFIAEMYLLPVRDSKIDYVLAEYQRGGSTRFTRKRRTQPMRDER